ncbi:toxin-antitoxin system, antitoxin component, ribbon-helix-helix domain protein, partial [Teladorsagia circumcincta]
MFYGGLCLKLWHSLLRTIPEESFDTKPKPKLRFHPWNPVHHQAHRNGIKVLYKVTDASFLWFSSVGKNTSELNYSSTPQQEQKNE